MGKLSISILVRLWGFMHGSTATPLAVKSFAKEQSDGNDNKLKPKLAWLTGYDMVYCGSVGGTATNKLIKLGAHPVIVKGGPDIEEIITELQQEITGVMSPLLGRIFKQKTGKNKGRFDEMADKIGRNKDARQFCMNAL
jgi:nitrogen fixation protein NifX